MIDTHDTGDQGRPSKIRLTVVIQNRYTVDDGAVTGNQIKEMANIPAGFSLHRRANGGKELIGDDQEVDVHNGDHFFAQPHAQPGLGHSEEL
ncbi:MAG: multiubiquitin domain-containing protein [Chloroflexota bacterium]|nr:multiubiquitin domain-containing protein [Chloroflexota bacterium]